MKELYCKLMHLLLIIIFLCLVSTKVFDLRICDILLLTFLIICVSVFLSVNNATAIIFASNGYESYYAIDSMVVLVCNGFTVTIIVHPHGVFTLAYSGTVTGTGAGTGIMQNISHYTGTGTGTGTGRTLFTCPK